MHTALLGRRDGLISAQVSTSSPSLIGDQVKRIGESARWADLTIRLHQAS